MAQWGPEEHVLGVMVTESFTSSKQCKMAAGKANKVLGVINKTFTGRDNAITFKK